MSGITLDDIAEQEVKSPSLEMETIDPMDNAGEPSRANEMFNKVLTAETGDGSIGDYIDHPMNFNKSQGLAQILRGLTGMVGNLNLAIIDVVMGALRFSREKKGVINHGIPGGGELPS